MTNQVFPITPPPGWVFELLNEACKRAETLGFGKVDYVYMVNKSAQWGADRELEVCVQLLDINGCPDKWIDMLRAASRPKPPSEADQALADLDALVDDLSNHGMGFKATNMRRALERLKKLEALPNG